MSFYSYQLCIWRRLWTGIRICEPLWPLTPASQGCVPRCQGLHCWFWDWHKMCCRQKLLLQSRWHCQMFPQRQITLILRLKLLNLMQRASNIGTSLHWHVPAMEMSIPSLNGIEIQEALHYDHLATSYQCWMERLSRTRKPRFLNPCVAKDMGAFYIWNCNVSGVSILWKRHWWSVVKSRAFSWSDRGVRKESFSLRMQAEFLYLSV